MMRQCAKILMNYYFMRPTCIYDILHIFVSFRAFVCLNVTTTLDVEDRMRRVYTGVPEDNV